MPYTNCGSDAAIDDIETLLLLKRKLTLVRMNAVPRTIKNCKVFPKQIPFLHQDIIINTDSEEETGQSGTGLPSSAIISTAFD